MMPPIDHPSASPGATATLAERLLGKIVQAGPATPCAVWVGAYNRDGRHSRPTVKYRPVIKVDGRTRYVTPTLLTLAVGPRPAGHVAAHRCPTGTPPDGVYRCVDLACLRWATHQENEDDKRRVG